ncbi:MULTISPECIES: hypothetical protein [Moorena]|nr:MULTISPECIES: hypothetical protein [Moorena]NEO16824.1 hypothetical protein [Moorena sp. SIO3E8]NEQ00895.1 hypothetical protein [Moorena sp. SIO3F7]
MGRWRVRLATVVIFLTPDSRLPTPDSRLPTPDSRLPVPCFLFPVAFAI